MWRELGTGFGFLAPNVIGFLIFTLLPVFAAFMLSFTQWDAAGLERISFVGFMNYTDLIKDAYFWRYLMNTMVFMAGIPLGMAVSLGLALAMNQKLRGIVVYRTLYFLPYISSIVAVALLWQWIYNKNSGILNEFIQMIGITNPPNWLGDTFWAKPAVILMQIWKGAGYNMMIYLAALQAIPQSLYEAADIDGASGWQKFISITMPMLSPTHFFVIVMGIIGGLQSFAEMFVLTDGGPDGATTTIVYHIYKKAFTPPIEMGYATATAVVLFALTMVITMMQWRLSKKVEI
jgi:multiple sugar transport system permease protein